MQKNLWIFGLFVLIFSFNGKPQSLFNVNFDSLIQKADAVVYENIIEIKIEDESEADIFVSKKILIKKSKEDHRCKIILSASPFEDVYDIEARITNPGGLEIKELDSDVIKEAEYSGSDFYNGNKYKYFDFSHTSYPFILEYKYKIKISTLLLWPDWYPQEDIPSYYSSYTLNINPDVKFKYYNKGIDPKPEVTKSNNKETYLWELKNIPPKSDEEYLPPSEYYQMGVLFVPENFYAESYQGSTKSWDEYSNWYKKLTTGRYDLPDEAKIEIQDLIKDAVDKKDKIKILYNYLQKKNRYVAIEMGLAGWQPQSAEQVFKNRYGDCKDLSTFMVAMLNVAGIKSYPALALTKSKGDIVPELPSNQFNHCIVVVPMEKDSIWLECTSSYGEMGEMYYNIEDIYTLVIGDEKGSLVKTPQKKSFQNKWSSVVNAAFKLNDLAFSSEIILTGNQRDYVNTVLASSNSKDDLLFLTRMLGRNYSNLSIDALNLNDHSVDGTDYSISLTGTYSKVIPNNANRIFINPAIFNRQTNSDIPKEEVGNRKYPVFYNYPFLDVDTVFIQLPREYKMESKPENKTIENKFIAYKSMFDVKDNKLFYTRSFERKMNRIELSDYPEFYNSMKQIIEFDKAKFVLKKN